MKVNGKHLDLGLKVLISCLLAVFVFLLKDIKTDVREIRNVGQEYYGQLHHLELELEKLKLRVEWLGVIPPSENPKVSVEDLKGIVEMLKNAERDSQ